MAQLSWPFSSKSVSLPPLSLPGMSSSDARSGVPTYAEQVEGGIGAKFDEQSAGAPHHHGPAPPGSHSSAPHSHDHIKPPAAKLFVGQVPPACNESDLRMLFEPFGKLLELVIFRNRGNYDKRTSIMHPFTRHTCISCAISGREVSITFCTSPLPF